VTPARPSRAVFVGLLAVVLAQPLVAKALGSPVGRYSMFMRIERYHLDLFVHTKQGERAVSLDSIAPHLYRDSFGILLPARSTAVGADQVDLVEGGIGDIAELLCRLHPEAESARVRFLRGLIDEPLRIREVSRNCASIR
jgi:hypothetical protein